MISNLYRSRRVVVIVRCGIYVYKLLCSRDRERFDSARFEVRKADFGAVCKGWRVCGHGVMGWNERVIICEGRRTCCTADLDGFLW